MPKILYYSCFMLKGNSNWNKFSVYLMKIALIDLLTVWRSALNWNHDTQIWLSPWYILRISFAYRCICNRILLSLTFNLPNFSTQVCICMVYGSCACQNIMRCLYAFDCTTSYGIEFEWERTLKWKIKWIFSSKKEHVAYQKIIVMTGKTIFLCKHQQMIASTAL